MRAVLDLIRSDHLGAPETVELTDAGYLHLPAALAARYFAGDVLLAGLEEQPERALVLVPVRSADHGGLVLTQSSPAGDRSLLVHEVLGFEPVVGTFEVRWDAARGALVVPLGPAAGPEGEPDGHRGEHRGGPGAGPVGGLPRRDDTRGGGPAGGADVPGRADGTADGADGASHGGAAPGTQGGAR